MDYLDGRKSACVETDKVILGEKYFEPLTLVTQVRERKSARRVVRWKTKQDRIAACQGELLNDNCGAEDAEKIGFWTVYKQIWGWARRRVALVFWYLSEVDIRQSPEDSGRKMKFSTDVRRHVRKLWCKGLRLISACY